MKKKIVCLLIAMMSMMVQAGTVLAVDEIVPENEANIISSQNLEVEENVVIEPRYQNLFVIYPSFSISNGTAYCALDVQCRDDSVPVTAYVILYEAVGSGKSVVDSWTIEDTGMIMWNDSATVSGGKYIMSVTVTSGTDRYSKEFTKYC